MNDSVIDYTGCCSRLERIASKRKMYGSESDVRLNSSKDSKLAVSTENVLLDEVKSKSKLIPFICAGSANKSHHMGVNLQMTLSMIKRFPGSNSGGHECPANGSSGHVPATSHKTSKDNGAGAWQQSSDAHACPARRENAAEDDNETFDGTERDPWTVRQTEAADVSQNDCRKTACCCWSRATESYYKVVNPFVADTKRKHDNRPFGAVQNPYTKEKLVKYYEMLSKHLVALKSAMIAMNNEFLQLTVKYRQVYQQYVQNQNGSLAITLLQTEDELNALKSKIDETVDVYNEAVSAVTQKQCSVADWNARSQARAAGADQDVRSRETVGVRMSRVLRRIQFLQEKLKSAHIVHGPSGDQAAVVVNAGDDDLC